ncbi:MAG TPA: putative glycoside hydrolase, partial [Bacillota bacterium]
LTEEVKKGRTGETLSAEAEARRRRAADKYGIYVNYAWKKFEDHLPFIKKHNLNSIVVDFKNDQGLLTYNTKLAFPYQIGAVSQKFRIEELIEKAHANGVYVIGRVVVFKDRQLHKYNNYQYAVWDKITQKPWVTNEYWVDPFSAEVWEYNIAIAKELEELGIDEVQFDYIRFPTDGDLSRIAFRHQRPGMLKVDALESFLAMAREQLEIPISADLYGFNCWYRMEGLTGQDANIFSDYVDVIAPMFYPSHFPGSFYGKEAYTKRARLIYEEGVARAARIVEDRCLIRPYVQAFLLGGELKMKAPQYTQYLLEQIEGTLAAPSSGFTLWNNSNNYYMVKKPLSLYIPGTTPEQESGAEQ